MKFSLWLETTKALPPSRFIDSDGMLTMYHFTHRDHGEQFLIDPSKTTPNRYSRREYSMAGTKRTFFYLDLRDKESFVGNYSYFTRYPASKIYNVLLDPLELKKRAKEGEKMPSGQLVNAGAMDFDKLLKLIKEADYDGMYYKPDNMELVTMLVPVMATSF